jgi:hypothetical protein
MIHKLEGRAGIVGRRMPFNGPPYLTDGQIQSHQALDRAGRAA